MSAKRSVLNQRQWLNIVIVVIAALVLFFVLIGRLMDPERNSKPPVEKRQVELVRLDFGGVEIWREDSGWRSNDERVSAHQAALMVEQWNRLIVSAGTPYSGPHPQGKTVLLYFSNIAQPQVCKLSLQADKLTLTFISSDQQFTLPVDQIELYYPRVN